MDVSGGAAPAQAHLETWTVVPRDHVGLEVWSLPHWRGVNETWEGENGDVSGGFGREVDGGDEVIGEEGDLTLVNDHDRIGDELAIPHELDGVTHPLFRRHDDRLPRLLPSPPQLGGVDLIFTLRA